MFIRDFYLNLAMNEKDDSSFHFPFYLTKMFFTILLVSFTVIGSLTLNTNYIAISQQQQQLSTNESNNNQISYYAKQQPPFLEDLSFDIDNVTFSHHIASVNGIQLHYVIGGQGDPLVLLHGFPQSWYEWRHIMPPLAKIILL